MRISDWSSDVCSSDLLAADQDDEPWSAVEPIYVVVNGKTGPDEPARQGLASALSDGLSPLNIAGDVPTLGTGYSPLWASHPVFRSEEHTSELQSLMRISYAVFCLKKKKNTNTQ